MTGHLTRESFMRATRGQCAVECLFCNGWADDVDHVNGCPEVERISNADAIAGLRSVYAKPEGDIRAEHLRELQAARRQQL